MYVDQLDLQRSAPLQMITGAMLVLLVVFAAIICAVAMSRSPRTHVT